MRLQRRLNATYQKLKRDRHEKAKNLMLSDAEYRLWDLFIALYDWDSKHTETYRTIACTDREIASLLNWSPAKVCRTRNKIIRKNLISQVSRGCYKIEDLENLVSNTQQRVSSVQGPTLNLQQRNSSVQQEQGKIRQSSIVSYKDTFNDYGLSEEDREWINNNVTL